MSGVFRSAVDKEIMLSYSMRCDGSTSMFLRAIAGAADVENTGGNKNLTPQNLEWAMEGEMKRLQRKARYDKMGKPLRSSSFEK